MEAPTLWTPPVWPPRVLQPSHRHQRDPTCPSASTRRAHPCPCSPWSCCTTQHSRAQQAGAAIPTHELQAMIATRTHPVTTSCKDREATTGVTGISSTQSPACPRLTQARPVPHSCPCVGKARRGVNPECSRSLQRGCAVLSDYRCCHVKRLCVEEWDCTRCAPAGGNSKASPGASGTRK